MRTLILLALAGCSTLASAQSQFGRPAGVFVIADEIDVIPGRDDEVALAGVIGWRFGNRLDAGVFLLAGRTNESDAFVGFDVGVEDQIGVGAQVGYVFPVGTLLGARVLARGELGRTLRDRAPVATVVEGGEIVGVTTSSDTDNRGEALAALSVFRRVLYGGTLLQPTLTGSAEWTVLTRTPSGNAFTLRADAPGGSVTRAVLRAGASLPLSTRAFGGVLTLEPEVSYVFGETDDLSGPESRFRLRFNR
ncbi:MAG: hypothetical protein AAGK21_09955 [Bacteroidota bacterium]